MTTRRTPASGTSASGQTRSDGARVPDRPVGWQLDRLVVIPMPPNTLAWVVWEDGALTGPHAVAACAMSYAEDQWPASIETDSQGVHRLVSKSATYLEPNEAMHSYLIPGAIDSGYAPWVSGRLVFFNGATAQAEAAAARDRLSERNATKPGADRDT